MEEKYRAEKLSTESKLLHRTSLSQHGVLRCLDRRLDRLFLVLIDIPFFFDQCDYSGKMSTNWGPSTHSYLLLLVLTISVSCQVDYSQYVNPLISSEGPIPGLAFGGG
jgi:hypothetical protein